MIRQLSDRFALGLALSLMVGVAAPAGAVEVPAAIRWTAPPAEFVASLYRGVLGRAPKSDAVVADWARLITNDPRSRLALFNRLVNSAAYRRAHPKGTRGKFKLWTNQCPRSRAERYAVLDVRPYLGGPWRPHKGKKWSMSYAEAVMGYRQAFAPFRPCAK